MARVLEERLSGTPGVDPVMVRLQRQGTTVRQVDASTEADRFTIRIQFEVEDKDV